MNRAARRSLKRVVAHALKGKRGLSHPVPGSVTLEGGPMHGWIVTPDAPSLRPDWHTTWNLNVAPSLAGGQPGRYVLNEDGKRATWLSQP